MKEIICLKNNTMLNNEGIKALEMNEKYFHENFRSMILEKVDYFSTTIFKKKIPILSYCNHEKWWELYRRLYNSQDKAPPVQKYILNSNLSVIDWDLIIFDPSVKDFIKARNDVVGVKNTITVLIQNSENLSTFTFGTKKNKAYLKKLIFCSFL